MSGGLEFQPLRQVHIDWLIKRGVSPNAMINPTIIGVARGTRASDGLFEPDPNGSEWLVFAEETDTVLWRPATGEIATDNGSAFALGGDDIRNPGVTALGGWLSIHLSPLEWLRNERRGIFVIRWEWAHEQLRDVARIALPAELLNVYIKAMTPRMPELAVIRQGKMEIAA